MSRLKFKFILANDANNDICGYLWHHFQTSIHAAPYINTDNGIWRLLRVSVKMSRNTGLWVDGALDQKNLKETREQLNLNDTLLTN